MKHDLKLMKRRGKDISKLEKVLDILICGDDLPEIYKDHQLKGEMRDFRECHIESDWLLVYKKEDEELILYATATGTHADIFGL
jgi:mRNA interferase YafQ